MKRAIIDMGSNSIRLTLYETHDKSFGILFRKKIMAGLASYVEDVKLSAEGIECACAAPFNSQEYFMKQSPHVPSEQAKESSTWFQKLNQKIKKRTSRS